MRKGLEQVLVECLDRNGIDRKSDFGMKIWIACEECSIEVEKENFQLRKRIEELEGVAAR